MFQISNSIIGFQMKPYGGPKRADLKPYARKTETLCGAKGADLKPMRPRNETLRISGLRPGEQLGSQGNQQIAGILTRLIFCVIRNSSV